MILGAILLVIAGFAYLLGKAVIAIIVTLVAGFILFVTGRRRLLTRRLATEQRRYDRSRLIGRRGLPEGQRTFTGKSRTHEEMDCCDGWCDGDRASHVVRKRRKAHED